MRLVVITLVSLAAVPAGAQVSYPPTDAAARAEAAAAKLAADQAAFAAAQACAPGSMMPKAEAVNATAGTATTCKRSDEVPLRISRTVSGVTGASGTGAVTWPAMTSVPKLTVTAYVTSTEMQVPTCYPVMGTVTTTGATIKCFRTQTLLGLGLVPFTVAPAGVTFDVLALPGS